MPHCICVSITWPAIVCIVVASATKMAAYCGTLIVTACEVTATSPAAAAAAANPATMVSFNAAPVRIIVGWGGPRPGP